MTEPKYRRQVAGWLFVCAFFIAVMVVIGGLTRLTGSGLSITEWDLVMGTLPPLNEVQWQEVFALYQQSPEYKLVNVGMTMAEFRSIFWWEYVHRLIGRTVGFVFLLPLLYFLIRRVLSWREFGGLLLLFVLGGLQGVLGWYMVKSGLVNEPHVSHYRLTAHLCLAFVLFGATLWQAFRFRDGGGGHRARLFPASVGLIVLIMLQVALGAMVAGLKAGLLYSTFPKMGDHWVPPSMAVDMLNNPVAMQFVHRITAYGVVLAVAVLWGCARWGGSGPSGRDARLRGAADFLLGVVAVQFLLGVFTLLLHVPVALAALHQFGALVLLGGAVYQSFVLGNDRSAVAE